MIAVAALSAFWPRFVDLSEWPDEPLASRYEEEARATLGWARDNPVQQAMDAMLVQQWRFSGWREVAGSGEGSTSLPSLIDVQVNATALGPWGVPIARYTIGCGGACYQRVD
ncbi:hypothetical protein BMF35_a0302 [Aurantiacibacter gangjinensis]|nr:hypothetical protein BMF35_a0302 [Aurantiacibacter gangjinensis]